MIKVKSAVVVFLFVFLFCSGADAGYMRGHYYDLDETYDSIYKIAADAPEVAGVFEIGKSVEGRPLLCLKISRGDGLMRGEALITAGVHADEWMGTRVALAIAERLAAGCGSDPWADSLLDRMDFYILPLMNPDGYHRAAKHMKFNFTMARDNARHVDLNRNWPYPEDADTSNIKGGLLRGSNFKYNPNYKGPYPLSEPENVALDSFVASRRFFMALDFHTTGGHYSYAWSFKGEACRDRDIFEAIGAEAVKHQELCRYRVHQSYDWYQILGASKDWFYAQYGVLAATVEVGCPGKFELKKLGPRILNPFWWANPLDIQAWIDNDCEAFMRAVEKGFELTRGKPVEKQDIKWVMN